ncbi:MAG: PQQ-binding-like beta-propeller repeat protein, partial [Acidimicrobiales bacterium]
MALAACGSNGRSSPAHFPPAVGLDPVPPAPAGSAPAAAWPSAGHDARHSGSTALLGPTTGRIRWERRLEGPVTPGPAVGADGTIYAASNGGVLHALDPRTGVDRWTYDGGGRYGSDLSTTPAVLDDGTVGLLLAFSRNATLRQITCRTASELRPLAATVAHVLACG